MPCGSYLACLHHALNHTVVTVRLPIKYQEYTKINTMYHGALAAWLCDGAPASCTFQRVFSRRQRTAFARHLTSTSSLFANILQPIRPSPQPCHLRASENCWVVVLWSLVQLSCSSPRWDGTQSSRASYPAWDGLVQQVLETSQRALRSHSMQVEVDG